MNEEVDIHIWCNGNPSVGIDGVSAVLRIYEESIPQEIERYFFDQLRIAFEEIWDNKVYVAYAKDLPWE